jgi:putative component of membrane protein insertase Oxa1/YidC/SpoIIIJ protein YidD
MPMGVFGKFLGRGDREGARVSPKSVLLVVLSGSILAVARSAWRRDAGIFRADAASPSAKSKASLNGIALSLIRNYQRRTQSAGVCRFEPSCSVFGAACFEKYSFGVAARRTAWRVLRCNDWNHGPRVDPP